MLINLLENIGEFKLDTQWDAITHISTDIIFKNGAIKCQVTEQQEASYIAGET